MGTSAWIEFLRDAGSHVRESVDGLLSLDVAIRSGTPRLRADADFTALARHAPIVVHPDSTRSSEGVRHRVIGGV